MKRLELANPLEAFRLEGEVAVITGGASGIGRAAAIAMARLGARIAILDRNQEGGIAVASEIARFGGTAEAHALDVVDEEAVNRSMAAIHGLHGRLDILVNSAGIARRLPAIDLPLPDWERVIAVNVTGSFLCARAAARYMLGKDGRIVNIASIMGYSGGLFPNVSYQTSKGAVVNMTRTLAVEWAKQGIRVNGVAPTFIHTPLTKTILSQPETRAKIEDATPMGVIGEVEDVVGAVIFLSCRASSLITGETIAVDGGFLAQ